MIVKIQGTSDFNQFCCGIVTLMNLKLLNFSIRQTEGDGKVHNEAIKLIQKKKY